MSDSELTPILGYILYCENYDVTYKNHIYVNEQAAATALAGVSGLNRQLYAIRPVTIIGWKNVP